jgi:prefoldin subunit 5
MAEQELAWLKSQADMLSQQLEQINTRISELEESSG